MIPRLRLGVAGAVLLLVALSGLTVLAVAPFASADESAHVDYGLTLAQDGRLPTLEERVEPRLPLQRILPQHVANHPPLFYAVTGPLIAAGVDSGHPQAGLLAARAVSVLFSAGTVVLVAGFVQALFHRRRPDLAVAAAVLVATLTPFAMLSGYVYNDAMAVFFATATLVLIVRMVRDGPTAPRVALLALACLASLAVRAQNVGVVVVAMAACAAAAMLHRGGRGWARAVARGGGFAAVVLGACAAGIGWFYLRNLRLYGDPVGQTFVRDLFGLDGQTGSIWMLFGSPELLLAMVSTVPNGSAYQPPFAVALSRGTVGLMAVGVLFLALRLVRARKVRPLPAPAGSSWVFRVVLGSLLAAHALALVLMVARHVSVGGNAQQRYLYPALALVATVGAAGLLALPYARRGVVVVAAAAVGVILTLRTIGVLGWRWPGSPSPEGSLAGILNGLDRMGLPNPGLVLLLVAVAATAGLSLVGVSLWSLTRYPSAATNSANVNSSGSGDATVGSRLVTVSPSKDQSPAGDPTTP